MMCKHDYDIIKEVKFNSVYNSVYQRPIGQYVGGGNIPAWVFNEKQIIILKCKKCNKIKERKYTFEP